MKVIEFVKISRETWLKNVYKAIQGMIKKSIYIF